ncbi:MAG: glucose-6-phosphate isomerase, partial [Euzebyales bacterium]|nr:glucose-6-phosphate isomerase [Euzebyales bacterium]
FGPRFLHSTGQLHKGGPGSVVALQLTDEPQGGPDIPGRPYDFTTLVRAQAAGDLRSLRDHGRRVAAVTVDAAQLGGVAVAIEQAIAEPRSRRPR